MILSRPDARSVSRHETRSATSSGLMSEAVPTFTVHEDGRVDHHSGRRWCHHCRGVGGHYTQDHPSEPVSGTLSPRLAGVRDRG